jgi:hypothetical protein
MADLGNDRYAAVFPLQRVGRYLFTVEAWHDVFASLLEDIAKKRAAGAAVGLEVDEAVALLGTAYLNALALCETESIATLCVHHPLGLFPPRDRPELEL